MTCKTCRWFTPYMPCEVPEEVPTHVSILGVKFSRDPFCVKLDNTMRNSVISYNRSGSCKRMPEALIKRLTA